MRRIQSSSNRFAFLIKLELIISSPTGHPTARHKFNAVAVPLYDLDRWCKVPPHPRLAHRLVNSG